jgi:hypothetical protein
VTEELSVARAALGQGGFDVAHFFTAFVVSSERCWTASW